MDCMAKLKVGHFEHKTGQFVGDTSHVILSNMKDFILGERLSQKRFTTLSRFCSYESSSQCR